MISSSSMEFHTDLCLGVICEVKNYENQDQTNAAGNQVPHQDQLRLPDKSRSCQLAVLKLGVQLVAFSTQNARSWLQWPNPVSLKR